MQDLTPLDIQKQLFNRTFRGYAIDEVRAYLHVLAEEFEKLLKLSEHVGSENALLREEIGDYVDRERMLKDTLLSAQKVSEEIRDNAHREADIIVKEAELRAEKMISQAMQRVGELERIIQELKIERKSMRNKLQTTLNLFDQMIQLDMEQEASELPIAQMIRKQSSAQ
jgi:cell division initiation protein